MAGKCRLFHAWGPIQLLTHERRMATCGCHELPLDWKRTCTRCGKTKVRRY